MTAGDRASATVLVGFPEYREPARQLAEKAGMTYAEAEIHRFPDGESLLRLPERLPPRVVFCRSLHRPNTKLVELQLAAATARRLGARHLTLVAPYLCYMRQDKAFHPGEAVSQTIIGGWLATMFDALLTVDPHLHRVHQLCDAVPLEHAVALTATSAMADFLAANIDDPLLIGPDAESEQWVAAIARRGSFEYAIAGKQRLGDREVRIAPPPGDHRGRRIVLVDDIASTGCTLAETAKMLMPCRPESISVLVTHALFVDTALQRLAEAGIGDIWSSDSIPHSSNRVHLVPLLADTLKRLP